MLSTSSSINFLCLNSQIQLLGLSSLLHLNGSLELNLWLAEWVSFLFRKYQSWASPLQQLRQQEWTTDDNLFTLTSVQRFPLLLLPASYKSCLNQTHRIPSDLPLTLTGGYYYIQPLRRHATEQQPLVTNHLKNNRWKKVDPKFLVFPQGKKAKLAKHTGLSQSSSH